MLTMHRICLLSSYLACVGHARRVQTAVGHLYSSPLVNDQRPAVALSTGPGSRHPAAEVNCSSRRPGAEGRENPMKLLVASDPAAAFHSPSVGTRLPAASPDRQEHPTAYGGLKQPSLGNSLLLKERSAPAVLMGGEDALKNNTEAVKANYEITRQKQGQKHPDTIAAMNVYAESLGQEGSLVEAKPLMRETLKLARQILGPTHPETHRALKNYEETFGGMPLMSIFIKLGLKGYYRNFAFGAGLVASVLWMLRLMTSHLDVLAHSVSPTGISSTVSAAIAGIFAGGLHTMSGVDHLAALAPLALRSKQSRASAFRIGFFWGSAHVLGQVLLGVLLLLASRSSFFVSLAHSWGLAEVGENVAAVALGIVLILIGIMGLREARLWDEDSAEEEHQSDGSAATFLTGVVSGMQPDALLFCLPALALPSRVAAFNYLFFFGGGTLAAMGGYAVVLQAACSSLGSQGVKRVSAIFSGVAITLGVLVAASALGMTWLQRFL